MRDLVVNHAMMIRLPNAIIVVRTLCIVNLLKLFTCLHMLVITAYGYYCQSGRYDKLLSGENQALQRER